MATRLLGLHARLGGGETGLDDPGAPAGLPPEGRDRARVEESLANVGVDLVHLRLQLIEVFVQPADDDVVYLRIGELRAERPERLLDRMPEDSGRRSRDGVHGLPSGHEAVPDRAWELTIEDEEIDDAVGRDTPVALAEHLEGARRSQDRGPLDVVDGRADVFHRG